jgi:hypothetical protein
VDLAALACDLEETRAVLGLLQSLRRCAGAGDAQRARGEDLMHMTEEVSDSCLSPRCQLHAFHATVGSLPTTLRSHDYRYDHDVDDSCDQKVDDSL